MLIWIVALVALYVGALEWLANRAPERATEAAPATPPPSSRPGVRPCPASWVTAARSPRRTAVRRSWWRGGSEPPDPRARAPGPGTAGAGGFTPETISTLNDRLALLVRLGAAHDSGVLTDDEFRREKDRLLGV